MRHAMLAIVVAGTVALPARADDIHVLSAAAMQTVFKEVAADFERASSHRLVMTYATMGAIGERVANGEKPQLVIGSSASMARLVADGKVDPGSARAIAKVGVGIVVPAGEARLEVRSVDELRRALLGAKTIVYADPGGGGAAGIHVAKVIEKLGLAEHLKARTRYGAGGDVTEVTLAQGAGALGLTQISEIVGKPGAWFAGPLPSELQNYTGVMAAVPEGMPTSGAVGALLDFLTGPVAAAALKQRGMEPY